MNDVLVILRAVEREILEFIITRRTKKCIFFHDSCQNFLEFVMVYETEIPFINGVKDL